MEGRWREPRKSSAMADAREEYKQAATADDRVAALTEIAARLDPQLAEAFEREATELVGLRTDTVDFASDAVKREDIDEQTRFLIFTMGAIACRRATDRLRAR